MFQLLSVIKFLLQMQVSKTSGAPFTSYAILSPQTIYYSHNLPSTTTLESLEPLRRALTDPRPAVLARGLEFSGKQFEAWRWTERAQGLRAAYGRRGNMLTSEGVVVAEREGVWFVGVYSFPFNAAGVLRWLTVEPWHKVTKKGGD